MASRRKHLTLFISIAAVIVGWSVLLHFVTPQEIISSIGTSNGYIVITALAFIGGVSTVSATSFYTTVITFTLGGLDPLVLALLCAPALTAGDWIFYLFGREGSTLLGGSIRRRTQQLSDWLDRQPNWVVQLSTFVYAGFTPLPGDLLMIVLAAGKYRFRKVLIPLLLGNGTLVFLLGYFAQLGYKLL